MSFSEEAAKFEIVCLREENRLLRELIKHMWVHDGYSWNGFNNMTSYQKVMYINCVNYDGDEKVNDISIDEVHKNIDART